MHGGGEICRCVQILTTVLSTLPSWEFKGSCYGWAAAVYLQHHGVIDLCKDFDTDNLSEIELCPEVVSTINYYQSQSATSFLCENLAPSPGTANYSMQLKNMFETVESGSPVLFSYYKNAYLVETGHTVVFIGAFTDLNGNHYLIACDSNDTYYESDEVHYYHIDKDFTEICDSYNGPGGEGGNSLIRGFNWTAETEQFTALNIEGEGNPLTWYKVFFNHISAWLLSFLSSNIR